MAATPSEIEREISQVRNRVQCVLSDRLGDPSRQCEEYHRRMTPLRERLHRLRERYAHAAELIARCEVQIPRYESKLRAVDNERLVRKALALADRLNEASLDLESSAGQLAELARQDVDKLVARLRADQLGRTVASDYRCFLRGARAEIADLRSLLSHGRFEREEADLLGRIAAIDRQWDQYAESWAFGHEVLDECYAKLDELQALLEDARGRQQVKKAEAGIDELSALLGQLDGKTAQAMVDEITRTLLAAASANGGAP